MKSKMMLGVAVLAIGLGLMFGCAQKEPLPSEAPAPQSQVSALSKQSEGNPEVLAMMQAMNDQLSASGYNIAVNSAEYFVIGNGRPSDRILKGEFHWVAGDPNRGAIDITLRYVNDGLSIAPLEKPSNLNLNSGSTDFNIDGALDRAFDQWENANCNQNLVLAEVADNGANIDVVDNGFPDIAVRPALPQLDVPGFINRISLAAPVDIINGGWLPNSYFVALGSSNIIAVTFTFIFVDGSGNPVDTNNDGHFDAAFRDIYWNDRFEYEIFPLGTPKFTNIPAVLDIDIQTVSAHEDGHGLSIGHFGPPPTQLMSPVYAGVNHDMTGTDHGAFCSLYAQWPN